MIPKLDIDFPISRVVSAFTPWVKGAEYPYREGSAFYLNHARTGIRIALSSLNLPAGSKVGVSMYNCVTVMKAVESAGLEIEFIDLTDDLKLDPENLKAKLSGLSAIIVTHFYGITDDVDKIKGIVGGIPIIEDCAHAFGARFEDGRAAGTKGDFAVFSTGLGKFPSIGDGGVLVVNNNAYLTDADMQCKDLMTVSFAKETRMILISHIKYLIYRPVIYSILKHVKDRLAPQNQCSCVESLMPRYVRYLYEKVKPCLGSTISSRQETVRRLIDAISSVEGVYVPSFNVNCTNGFMLPVLVYDYAQLRRCKALRRFELSQHFANSPLWASEFGHDGNCSNAIKVAEHIVVIPTYKK